MKRGEKEGLSQIVTMLVLILLILVAIGIVWAVIRNLVESGSEEVSTGKFTVDFDLKKVTINDNSVDVTIKRNPGKGELQGIAFSINDGSGQYQVVKLENNFALEELEEKTFNLPYSGLVKDISISPIIKTGDGEGLLGEPQSELIFSTKDTLKNSGAISWWRLEGNARDEIGGNHGFLTGIAPPVQTSGKFDNALDFNGFQSYVNVTHDPSLDITGNITVGTWINSRNINSQQNIISRGYSGNRKYGMDLYLRNARFLYADDDNFGGGDIVTGSTLLQNDTWYHIAAVFNGSSSMIYINGNLDGIISKTTTPSNGTAQELIIAKFPDTSTLFFNGVMDELVIFNRALSEDEVKGLYKFNYNA